MARSRRWIIAGLAILLAVAGCASARLTNLWSVNGFSTPMASMLVIAIKPNEGNRRIIEDAFVAELGKYGVSGTASYTVWPSASPDTESVRHYLLENRLQGVVVAARLPTRRVRETSPGYTTTETTLKYTSWAGRYQSYVVEVEHPPTTEIRRIIPHRVDVWHSDGKGGELVWTGETESIDPSSVTQVSKEMTGVIVPELAKAGIIPGRSK